MQEIRLKYFFLPIRLQVQSNPGGEEVIVLQPTFLGTFEFLRLPVSDAHQFAGLLDTAAKQSSTMPLITGDVGEVTGIYVRPLGTGEIRIRLAVKRAGFLKLAIRQHVGMKYKYSSPKISVEEAHRFADAMRQANATTAT